MNEIAIIGDNIVSPLGWTTESNFAALISEKTGLKKHHSNRLGFSHFSGILNDTEINDRFSDLRPTEKHTRLEKLAILSISNALSASELDLSSDDVLFIVSTTKGNISLLDQPFDLPKDRLLLHKMAMVISGYFDNKTKPLIISNACISGVLAIVQAKRLLELNAFKHIIIVGLDEVSDFTLSGFNSLKALSHEQCKPFDKDRKGINLGDACATIILSNGLEGNNIGLVGGAVSNDANHISGPSRTGEGMYQVIQRSIAKLDDHNEIDFISAHGTATIYNDDMESIAIERCGLNQVPANSFKGYWGHTLGAAGIIESIATYHSILKQKLIASKGISELGTAKPINVITASKDAKVSTTLKVASGFGGCNASIIFKRKDG